MANMHIASWLLGSVFGSWPDWLSKAKGEIAAWTVSCVLLLVSLRWIWVRRPWARTVQFEVNTFEHAANDDLLASIRPVVVDELTFAGTSGHHLGRFAGPGSPFAGVEVGEELKFVKSVVDTMWHPCRYKIDCGIFRVSQSLVATVRLRKANGCLVASRSFSEPISSERDAALRIATRIASWTAFGLQRLRKWPFIRKHLRQAPRMFGTAYFESYAMFRAAMRSNKPRVEWLKESIALSPDNVGAKTEYAKWLLAERVFDTKFSRTVAVKCDEEDVRRSAYREAIEMLKESLETIERFPAVEYRWPRTPDRNRVPRDRDGSHNPSWSNREFPAEVTRRQVLDDYNTGVGLECGPCNRGAGNRRW